MEGLIRKYSESHPEADFEYLPSGIDIHVHFREPGFTQKETMASGLAAAHEGGISTVIDMPNTLPVTDTVVTLAEKLDLAKQYQGIYLAAGFTDRSVGSLELNKLALKTRILKAFLADSTGNLGIQINNFKKGLEQLSEKTIIIIHAEEANLISDRFEGCLENEVRPEIAEIEKVKELFEIIPDYPNLIFHITHVSTSEVANLLINKKTISWDVLAKHIAFDENMVQRVGNLARMNPPLRSKNTANQLRQFLKDGKIPIISSDHAPHTLEEKKSMIAGAPGVQETYPYLFNLYIRQMISMDLLVDVIYKNPLKLLNSVGIEPIQKTVIFDRNARFKFDTDTIKSKCNWSLWENLSLKGAIVGFKD